MFWPLKTNGRIRFWVLERHEWRIDNFQQAARAAMAMAGSKGISREFRGRNSHSFWMAIDVYIYIYIYICIRMDLHISHMGNHGYGYIQYIYIHIYIYINVISKLRWRAWLSSIEQPTHFCLGPGPLKALPQCLESHGLAQWGVSLGLSA